MSTEVAGESVAADVRQCEQAIGRWRAHPEYALMATINEESVSSIRDLCKQRGILSFGFAGGLDAFGRKQHWLMINSQRFQEEAKNPPPSRFERVMEILTKE